MNRSTKITPEWGEIGFGSKKREGWSYEVAFLVDGAQIDRHGYKTQAFAEEAARRFERGDYTIGEYGEVVLGTDAVLE